MKAFKSIDSSPYKGKSNLVGKRFARLLVTDFAGRVNPRDTVWECLCDCGEIAFVRAASLKKGGTKSCGCLHAETVKTSRRTHGFTSGKGHPLYWVHATMMQRCYNPNNPKYRRYGARGIRVCKRWHNAANFIMDLAPKWKRGLHMDRIDNDGNYTPKNLRFVTPRESRSNSSDIRSIKINGETRALREVASELGLAEHTLRGRLDKCAWPVELAVSIPKIGNTGRHHDISDRLGPVSSRKKTSEWKAKAIPDRAVSYRERFKRAKASKRPPVS